MRWACEPTGALATLVLLLLCNIKQKRTHVMDTTISYVWRRWLVSCFLVRWSLARFNDVSETGNWSRLGATNEERLLVLALLYERIALMLMYYLRYTQPFYSSAWRISAPLANSAVIPFTTNTFCPSKPCMIREIPFKAFGLERKKTDDSIFVLIILWWALSHVATGSHQAVDETVWYDVTTTRIDLMHAFDYHL